MKNKSYETIRFELIGIKTEQFATFEENFDINCEKTEISISFKIKINQSNKQIGILMAFNFIHASKQIIKLVVSCHFQINSEDWISLINENKLILNPKFVAHIAMITTGTARGILHNKIEGTIFSKIILPLINVDEKFNEDVVFNLEE